MTPATAARRTSQRRSIARQVRIEPPARFGLWASSDASTDRVGALPVLSTALRALSTDDLTNVRSGDLGRRQSGQGVSAPVIPRQRRFGWRAAVASSRRRTGALCGAPVTRSGVASASRGDRDQRIGERIERLDRFGLGRLDQHPLLDDQREVDRRRVEAVVDQPLGDVEGADAGLLLDGRGRATNSCLQARSYGMSYVPARRCLQVVGGQDGVVADLAQARRRRGPGCRRTRARGRRCCRRSCAAARSRSAARPAARGGTCRRPRAGRAARAGTAGASPRPRPARRPVRRRRAGSRTSCGR